MIVRLSLSLSRSLARFVSNSGRGDYIIGLCACSTNRMTFSLVTHIIAFLKIVLQSSIIIMLFTAFPGNPFGT